MMKQDSSNNYNQAHAHQYTNSNSNSSNNLNTHSSGNALAQSLKSNSLAYSKSLIMNDGKVTADKNFKTLKNNTINACPISPHK